MLLKTDIPKLTAETISSSDVKLKSRSIPRIFGLCWGPYPLHFKIDLGWGFLVPKGFFTLFL